MDSSLASATVTFLFTDIENSTKLWEKNPEGMQAALAQHDAILHAAIESNQGRFIKTTGDGVHASFQNAVDAVNATIHAQQQFQAPIGDIKLNVRMGIHTGEVELRAGDYFGTAVNRAARLMSIAHGGQILISNAVAELIRDQLGSDISLRDLGEHRLKDLSRPEHVFQVIHPGLVNEFPPVKSIDAFPNNLPIQLTSFVGREKEIAEIRALLKSNRLITLTGSGGTGKSRLALEVGTQLLSSFMHGVWLVELAPLADPGLILPAMAQTFGLHELPATSFKTLITDFMRDKQLLLLLDNCEHLIDACAEIADDLLHQSSQLKILASSREALGITGEIAYRTPSLAVSESTQLFMERAIAVNPKFHLTDMNASAITKICTRLDGIPLAIELAAARAKLLSPEQIAQRLDDRFRLLVGGSRTALPRQQTLRALIDWSYDQLPEEEKHLFQIASVFAGGWVLDALEAIARDPDTLDRLEQLVNKSLVITAERPAEMRYSMLETIRQYAREKLFDTQQAEEMRDRHFQYYDDLSEKYWEIFRSSDTDFSIWRDRADDEMENFRAAVEWGLEKHIEQAVHLAANFCIIAAWAGIQSEGLEIAGIALENVRKLPPVEGEANLHRQNIIARALFAQGLVSLGQGRSLQSTELLREAAAISRATGNKRILGYSLEMFYTASQFINVPGGPEAVQEGFQIFSKEIEDPWGLGMAYLNMARLAASHGDVPEKNKYYRMLKELVRGMPISFQSGLFFLGQGLDEAHRGNYETARQIFENGLVVFKKLRNRNFQTVITSELGHISRHTGDIPQARQIYRETIKSWQDLGNRPAIAHQLECFAFLAMEEHQYQRAAILFGAAEALRERIGTPMTDAEKIEYVQFITRLRSTVDEAELNVSWGDGRAMNMESAIQLAMD